MANEIRVLEGNGQADYQLLLLFPIAAPKQAGGVNVVPTPSSGLAGTAGQIAADVKVSLDAGTMAYRVVDFRKDSGLTQAQLVARAKAIYAAHLADFAAWYDQVYFYVGTTINYP